MSSSERDVEVAKTPKMTDEEAGKILAEAWVNDPIGFTLTRLQLEDEFRAEDAMELPTDVQVASREAAPYAVFEAGWNAGFQEAQEPDRFPWQNRCEVRFKELFPEAAKAQSFRKEGE